MSGIKDYYSIEEGQIANKVFQGRSFILPSSVWARIEERLYKDFESGAAVILFDMGQACGISLVNEAVKGGETGDSLAAVKMLARIATIAGWGKVIAQMDEGNKLKVKVENCVFCSNNADDGNREGRCHFLRGMISGAHQVIFNRPSKIKETHCSRKYCEFILIPEN